MPVFGSNIELKQNDVHLWLAFPDAIRNERLLSQYADLMSDAERGRYERYRFEKDRKLHLIARALLRTTLSRYAERTPEDWRFSTNAYGRPEIVAGDGIPPIRFNLSHTTGVVCCAVTLTNDIGVDVEGHDRVGEHMGISKRFFSAMESKDLVDLPSGQGHERFFHYWTLKESFIKAQGRGLSFPLDQFSFQFAENNSLRILFDPGLGLDSNHWHFWLMMPTPRHSLAVSVFKGNRPPANLTVYRVVPMVSSLCQPFPMIAQSA